MVSVQPYFLLDQHECVHIYAYTHRHTHIHTRIYIHIYISFFSLSFSSSCKFLRVEYTMMNRRQKSHQLLQLANSVATFLARPERPGVSSQIIPRPELYPAPGRLRSIHNLPPATVEGRGSTLDRAPSHKPVTFLPEHRILTEGQYLAKNKNIAERSET